MVLSLVQNSLSFSEGVRACLRGYENENENASVAQTSYWNLHADYLA